MSAPIGQVWDDVIVLVDGSNNPITGSSFNQILAEDPDGLEFNWSFLELGGGAYRVWFIPNKVGSYNLVLSALTTPVQYFDAHIDAAGPSPGLTSPAFALAGTSQMDLIRMVADGLQDLIETEVTDEGGSEGITWTDELNLAALSPKSMTGSELFVTVDTSDFGVNLYKTVRVLDSTTDPTPTLTLVPPLPTVTALGSQGDLTNLYSEGWRRRTYARVINQCINLSYPNHLSPLSATVADPFSRTAQTIAVPPSWTHISAVQWLDSDGTWQDFSAAPYGNAGWEGWAWDPSTQQIVIGGRQGFWADGSTIRLTGFGKAGPLTLPTDVTDLDPMWIVSLALKTMNRAKSADDPKKLAISMADANEAQFNLLRMADYLPEGTIKIR